MRQDCANAEKLWCASGNSTHSPGEDFNRNGSTDMDRIMAIWNAFFENAMRWRMGHDLRIMVVPRLLPAISSYFSAQGRKHAWAKYRRKGQVGTKSGSISGRCTCCPCRYNKAASSSRDDSGGKSSGNRVGMRIRSDGTGTTR